MADYAHRRTVMVDTQIRPSDVTKFPIIDAFLTVPRERFVPASLREAAYLGENIDLGGAILLEPRTLAKMLEEMDIEPDEVALDIGCGYGYSTAILARLTDFVVGVDQDGARAEGAQSLLSELGLDNAAVVAGPLAEGSAKSGPYDIIVINGGVEEVPQGLLDQLREGGRIGAVFMEGALGTVRIGLKSDGHVTWRYAFNAAAPVLDGFEKVPSFAL